MQFSLLLLILYVMCAQSNSIFIFLSDFLLTSDGVSPQFFVRNLIGPFYIHYPSASTYLQCSLQCLWKLEICVTQIICLASWSFEALCLVLHFIRSR